MCFFFVVVVVGGGVGDGDEYEKKEGGVFGC